MNLMNSMKCTAGCGGEKGKIMLRIAEKNVFLFLPGAKSCFWLIKLHDVHKSHGCQVASVSKPGMNRIKPVFNPENHRLTAKSEYFMNLMQFYVLGRFKRIFRKHYFYIGPRAGKKRAGFWVLWAEFMKFENAYFMMFIKSKLTTWKERL